jgi:hypothetical protein
MLLLGLVRSAHKRGDSDYICSVVLHTCSFRFVKVSCITFLSASLMAPQTVLRSASEAQAFTAAVIFSTRGFGFVLLLVDSVLNLVRTRNLRTSVSRKGQSSSYC